MNLRLLRELDRKELQGKRILFRVDFEVPVENGRVEDDFRIRAVKPTLAYLLASGAKVLLLTKRGHFDITKTPELSTKVLLSRLEIIFGEKIIFLENFPELEKFSLDSPEKLFLFENLRFWPEEEDNFEEFASKFARVADIYVSDNFGAAHRAHASVARLPALLPSYAGFLLEKEVSSLERLIENPKRPVAVILGGAKLETKLPLIKRFLASKDKVLVGGGLANSILFAKGVNMAESCREKEAIKFLEGVDLQNPNLYLPKDGRSSQNQITEGRITSVEEIKPEECFYDIGPKTIEEFINVLKSAKTIFWNGPLGMIEEDIYTRGTIELAKRMRKMDSFKIVGGGDLVGILDEKGLADNFNHLSTGGGSMLAFISGKKLPGLEILKKQIPAD